MFFNGGFGMGGMHGTGWFLWIILIGVILFIVFGRPGRRRETPHEVLRRRLASGEITTDEYEKRKALLDRDAPGGMG